MAVTHRSARILSAVSLAVVAAFTVSGCNNQNPTVTGTVTSRDQRHNPATHASAFYLTINSTEHEVSYATYSHCFRGSRYPTCKNH